MGLKAFLEDIEPDFEPGGKYEKFYALYEAAATIFYTPGKVTTAGTHVKDSIDLKRIMIFVWMATFPAMFYGMYNVGNQALIAIEAGGAIYDGWQAGLFTALGGSLNADSGWLSMMMYGRLLLYSDLRGYFCGRWILGSVVCISAKTRS